MLASGSGRAWQRAGPRFPSTTPRVTSRSPRVCARAGPSRQHRVQKRWSKSPRTAAFSDRPGDGRGRRRGAAEGAGAWRWPPGRTRPAQAGFASAAAEELVPTATMARVASPGPFQPTVAVAGAVAAGSRGASAAATVGRLGPPRPGHWRVIASGLARARPRRQGVPVRGARSAPAAGARAAAAIRPADRTPGRRDSLGLARLSTRGLVAGPDVGGSPRQRSAESGDRRKSPRPLPVPRRI